MDGPRFDSLTKLAAARMSRRTGLRAVLAALGVGAFGRVATARPARAASAVVCNHANCEAWTLAQLNTCVKGCPAPSGLPDPACQAGCLSDLAVDQGWCGLSGGCVRTDGFALLLDGPGTICMGGVCCPLSKANCGDGACCSPDRCCGGAPGRCCGDTTPYCVAGACAECPAGFRSCPSAGSTLCIDVVSSPNHCGGCDTPCAAGQECCDGTCVDGITHCGGACVGNACVPPQVFDRETCRCACPSITCPSGEPLDPDSCTCGCATRCPDGQTQDPVTCACACGGSSCAGSCCGGACVQPQTDPANCGGCGIACAHGQVCRGGRCACAAATPDACAGICTDFRSDPGNCGGCSVGPNGALFVCPSGGATPLPNCCGALCTDVSFDGDNCGRCGNACPEGHTCEHGTCGCQAGTTACAGRCVDLKRDSGNCGACGHACSATEVCCHGACASGQSACGDAVGIDLIASADGSPVFEITAHACAGARSPWSGTMLAHSVGGDFSLPIAWAFPAGGTKAKASVGPFTVVASGVSVTGTFHFTITLVGGAGGAGDALVFDLSEDVIAPSGSATYAMNGIFSNLGTPIPITHAADGVCP